MEGKDKLEDVEFYDLMQCYRGASVANQEHAIKCFENVKEFIREDRKQLQSRLEKAEELLKRHLEQKTAEEEMNYTTDVYAFLNEGKK